MNFKVWQFGRVYLRCTLIRVADLYPSHLGERRVYIELWRERTKIKAHSTPEGKTPGNPRAVIPQNRKIVIFLLRIG